ncbi:high mobility group B protein 15 [Medicago truncatula]|uniref:High mobility group B-like protein n=1 Tax=Medicago truncatula TaxID=3880 RepID=G7KWP7_MEDTR|nr:high mobility group B protein 15 [Medicago truncatula]AES77227.1 high mobility group B-like protein [Medicago truncatula]
MASTSCFFNNNEFPMKVVAPMSHSYPEPLAKYDDVVANPKLFMLTLEKLHASMGTKFMVPIIGGKELDLCRLFIEVTSRGGIEKLMKERRWKEVTAAFSFPSTATNASFVLRKYYSSLLYHYEQIYYFRSKRWTPASSDALQNQSTMSVPASITQFLQPSPGTHPVDFQKSGVNASELPQVSSSGSSLAGVIDGKFESGYLVSVSVGSETLKGVLYESPQSIKINNNNIASAALGVQRRRRRRKKSEIKRRDPAHPKPNRSGYNFFFAEQHARLKLLNQTMDKDISRMIGELWNNLKESEKTVYQEKAIKDKERYQAEMEDYRDKMKTSIVTDNAGPLQQRFPEGDSALVDVDIKMHDSCQTPEESSSGESDYVADDINMDASSGGARVDSEAFVDSDKATKEGVIEVLSHCEGEVNAGGIQQTQKMNESQNMLSLL